jgi:hypothetical protein
MPTATAVDALDIAIVEQPLVFNRDEVLNGFSGSLCTNSLTFCISICAECTN